MNRVLSCLVLATLAACASSRPPLERECVRLVEVEECDEHNADVIVEREVVIEKPMLWRTVRIVSLTPPNHPMAAKAIEFAMLPEHGTGEVGERWIDKVPYCAHLKVGEPKGDCD